MKFIFFLKERNTLCQQQRQDELNKAEIVGGRSIIPLGTFMPTCKKNGEFKETQCHGSTGYCWCVDENGKRVQGIVPAEEDLDCEKGTVSLLYILYIATSVVQK